MRTTFCVLLLGTCAVIGGCKSDSKPTSVSSNTSAGPSGGGPRSVGSPGKPFNRASFEAISALPFAAPATVIDLDDDALALKISPPGDRATAVTVRLSRCLNCVPIDRAQWEAHVADLKALLPKEIREKPDTVFELGDMTIADHKVIYVYQLGVHPVMDGQFTKSVMSTHAYTLHWNDGINQVQIVAKDASPPDAATVQELAAKIPRDVLGKLAADAFTTIAPHIHGT